MFQLVSGPAAWTAVDPPLASSPIQLVTSGMICPLTGPSNPQVARSVQTGVQPIEDRAQLAYLGVAEGGPQPFVVALRDRPQTLEYLRSLRRQLDPLDAPVGRLAPAPN